jgi:hypothetical protein
VSLTEYLHRLTENIFVNPYASQGRDSTGLFAPARKVSKKYALGMKTIQLNGPRQKRYLCFDIDREHAGIAWQDANLPIPNLIIRNPRNGHAHLVWELAQPVWERRRDDDRSGEALPVRYMNAVYRAMREALGADPAYNGLLVKNPLHPDWHTICGRLKPYTLEELSQNLDLTISEPTRLRDNQEGRNCTLFDSIRIWAYRAKSSYRNLVSFREATQIEIESLNDQLDNPLPDKELIGIVKSVSHWVWNNYTGSGRVTRRGICNFDPNTPLEQRQKLGQSHTTWTRVNNTITKINLAIKHLINLGIKLTKTAIAKQAGLNRKTLYRHWNKISTIADTVPAHTLHDNSTPTLVPVTSETASLRDRSSRTPSVWAGLAARGRYPDIHSLSHSVLSHLSSMLPGGQYPPVPVSNRPEH